MELGLVQDSISPAESTKMHGYQYIATYSWTSAVKEGRASWFENTQILDLTIRDVIKVLINNFTHCPAQQ